MHFAIIKALEERQRQIHEEGFTAEHDDQNKPGTLLWAAGCYAMHAGEQEAAFATRSAPPFVWPWHSGWWKPSPDPKRNIIKAMALLAAEYDRIERAEAAPGKPLEQRYSTDDEWQSNIYKDLTELINDRERTEGDEIYIGTTRRVKATEFTVNLADSVIENMQVQAEDTAGENGEDYPDPGTAQRATLQALIDAWALLHCPPDFYTIANVRAYTLTRDDIANASVK